MAILLDEPLVFQFFPPLNADDAETVEALQRAQLSTKPTAIPHWNGTWIVLSFVQRAQMLEFTASQVAERSTSLDPLAGLTHMSVQVIRRLQSAQRIEASSYHSSDLARQTVCQQVLQGGLVNETRSAKGKRIYWSLTGAGRALIPAVRALDARRKLEQTLANVAEREEHYLHKAAPALRDALTNARVAIASLGSDALGGHEPNHPEDEGYSFRDALLAEIDAALALATVPADDNGELADG